MNKLKNIVGNKAIRKRVLVTLFILTIFQLGTQIPIPLVNEQLAKTVGSETQFLQLLNMLSGGGMNNFSILALGITPYITATIVIQLLQMDLVPKFVEWGKQGNTGREKLNKVTRYTTILLALAQAIGIVLYMEKMSKIQTGGVVPFIAAQSTLNLITVIAVLVVGALVSLWLGEKITEKGLGNGVSVIILGGIIARLPNSTIALYRAIFSGKKVNIPLGVGISIGVVLLVLALVVLTVFFQNAERRIPIQFTKKAIGTSSKSYLPFKVNPAGVIPVIFASSTLSIFGLGMQLLGGTKTTKLLIEIRKCFDYSSYRGILFYLLLILLFTYFYSFVQVNPEKVADNLVKQSSYITGVLPGVSTEKYVASLLMRLATFGSIFLVGLSVIPLLCSKWVILGGSFALGGTGLLIVVGTVLEMSKQLDGLLKKRTYNKLLEGDIHV